MAIYKEKTNSNKVPATLFVGCGGIGSGIVTDVAKRCKPGETENLRFVVMDTDVNDLKKVKGSNAVITAIQTSSTQAVGDYLKKDEEARKKWFPCNATLYSKTVSEGAGQVRAISRLAVNATITTGEIQKLYKQIDSLFLKNGNELTQALRVVIVSSACGGTGSGIAMMVGMIIRNYLHKHYREKSCVIRGFLLLPGVMDTIIKTQSEQESLRRNGYATIKEINAFMMKASGFFDVKKELERFTDLHIDVPTTEGGTESLDCLPFDFCFLLDRVNKRQENMETLPEYKEFAAQSIYEQNIGCMQSKAFSMEDNIIKEFASKDNLGRNRFGGIGASILRYPYEDIADYIAYCRALDRIGGTGAGDWSKYDKAYKLKRAEYNKKKASTTEKEPTIGSVYVEELTNDEMRFGQVIKGTLADNPEDVYNEVSENVEMYLDELISEILRVFTSQEDIETIDAAVSKLCKALPYDTDESVRGKAVENLGRIRQYEAVVKKNAKSIARTRAKSIFHNSPSLHSDDLKPYFIENLLRSNNGGMHPNAMRYVLYVLEQVMEDSRISAESDVKDCLKKLEKYSGNEENPDLFDIKAKFSKDEEKNIDDVCALEKEDPGFFEKIGGYSVLWDALNQHLPAYSKSVVKLRDAYIRLSAFEVGCQYLKQINSEFERFYNSFEMKVGALERKKLDIIESLKYRKGQAVYNVCSSQEMIEELLRRCPENSDGMLLPGSLNADIFDAAKSNAAYRRESKFDPFIPNTSVDLFDKVINYFREVVRDDCKDVINMNIIQAIRRECILDAFFKANVLRNEDDEKVMPIVEDDQKEEYLNSRIKFGSRLAAPGISSAGFEEPREVSVCSYSTKLLDMTDINISSLFERNGLSGIETDTVSQYEIHFFNALYNISPDKLSRFKCVMDFNRQMQDSSDDTGIYFKAYHDYIKDIGPDSTKSATISVHIDKRWDTVAEMPEMSIPFQKQEMMSTHAALVYGLVHEMIKTYPSSTYDSDKRIFKLEDEEGELTPFIVSNRTECDEFYEVLDALYRDRASVTMIYSIAEAIRSFDAEKNHHFNETTFVTDMNTFKIGEGHKAPTSLFEIPLAYYNSLPSSKQDDNELSIMIDSIIQILCNEIEVFEQENNRAPYLCKVLEQQYRLLIQNFLNDEYNEKFDIRKNSTIEENRVISIVCRKINRIFKDVQVSDYDRKIEEFRRLAKGIVDEIVSE